VAREPEEATGRPTSRADLVPQPHGGALAPPFRPGSNGGVPRGPDRVPRVTAAAFMRALTETQRRKRGLDSGRYYGRGDESRGDRVEREKADPPSARL
jgi:hypothetical protein